MVSSYTQQCFSINRRRPNQFTGFIMISMIQRPCIDHWIIYLLFGQGNSCFKHLCPVFKLLEIEKFLQLSYKQTSKTIHFNIVQIGLHNNPKLRMSPAQTTPLVRLLSKLH